MLREKYSNSLVAPFLDVSDIKFVINFDFPNNTEDYVHRIGRTARAKNTGTAYTYFTSQNAKQAKELVEVLKEAHQNINPKLYDMMQLAKQIFHSKSKWYAAEGVCAEVCACCMYVHCDPCCVLAFLSSPEVQSS